MNENAQQPPLAPPRCRPGDIAIVISAQHRRNLGLVVHVVGPDPRERPIRFPDEAGVVWTCECAQPLTWNVGKKIYRRKRGPVPDSRLQPIRARPPRDPADGVGCDLTAQEGALA